MCEIEKETNLENEEDDNLFQHDIGQSFESALTDLPEVSVYIKRLQDCVTRQRRIIIALHERLKQWKPNNVTYCDASTQTDGDDASSLWQQSVGASKSSIVDQVKEAAECAVRQTGFVYEATSGMYYDYNTGYYYNAELGLYYDGNSGTYYSYNEEDKEFRYHSSIGATLPQSNDNSAKSEHLSSAESKTVDLDSKNNLCSLTTGFSQLAISETLRKNALEIANSWPPCMRVTVQETDLDNLNVGSLFIVTCIGGTLGREGDHSIVVPDLKISKHHAKISFCEEMNKYVIVDLGSRNGTYLNGTRLSVALQESDPKPLNHGDILRVGMTHLLCHIHQGQETCQQCEPGCCVPSKESAKVETTDSTEYSRDKHRTELRRLRKKFGLENAGASAVVPNTSNYVDRAEARRKTVGSTDESFKTETASVHETIKCDNKGFKMLSKMGWSEGQALGRDTSDPSSIKEPIVVEQRRSKVGLGCEDTEPVTSHNKEVKKAMIWKKARKRYNKLN